MIWKERLNKVKPYKPGKPIEEVKRELGLDSVIKLASNENPMPPSPKVIAAVKKAADEVNRYPDGWCFSLRKALCEKLSIDELNLVFGNGSDEILVLAIRAFVDAGNEVVMCDPTFLVYGIASSVEGAKIVTVPMKDLEYDVQAVIGSITENTKMVFIANPDNPTGSYINSGDLSLIIEKLPKNALLVIDEAYYEYASGGDYPETIDLVKRTDKNVIITRTFSKAYGLAGLRVGYGIARRDMAEAMNKVREPFNVNSLAQVAAVAAMDDDGYMAKSVSLVKNEKERFYSYFEKEGLSYKKSLTNFVLVNTQRDSGKVFEALLKKGVIVRDMGAWKIDGYIRVNVGLKEENDRFFESFSEVLKDIKKS